MAADLHDSTFWNIANYEIRPWGVLVDSVRRSVLVDDSTRRVPIETKNWSTVTVVDAFFEYKTGKFTTLGIVFHDSLGQTIVAEAPDPRRRELRANADARKELTDVRAAIKYYKNSFGHRSKQLFKILGLPFVEPRTPISTSRLILSPILQFGVYGKSPGRY
jgi:hypothetical protein